MQNRYAGDLGDYAKCGLLRVLCRDDLHLGMVWYLTDDESHNNDGRHRPSPAMRDCDPAMYEAFRTIGRRRGVARLQAIDAWPDRVTFFDEPLNWAGVADRRAHRAAWVERALKATHDCDLICVDPDNGLEVASVRRTAPQGPKYAWLDELQPFWRRGQSLVIYQHANRQAPVAEQARRRVTQLRQALPGGRIETLRFRRGTSRLFFIAMQPIHRVRLLEGVDRLIDSSWSGHFQRI